MKKYILFMTLLIFLLTLKICAGEYRPTKLIAAKWGEKDGEFGLIMEDEANCPQSLTIDDKGNLAILDAVNNRVQLYSSEGKWIGKFTISSRAFDIKFEGDRIVLLAPYDHLIEQYNREGKLIEKVNINRNIELIDGLRISGQKIFVQTTEQMQYSVEEKSKSKQLQSMQKGFSARIADVRFQTRWVDPYKGSLLIDNKKTAKAQSITITSQDELGSLVFLDTDSYGNIYIRKELFSSDGKSFYEVDKFDNNGSLLVTIRFENENIVLPYNPITVDSEGNIYFLV
ncbi:MAG: hypothetical protein JSW07_17605, partial [bacterium]